MPGLLRKDAEAAGEEREAGRLAVQLAGRDAALPQSVLNGVRQRDFVGEHLSDNRRVGSGFGPIWGPC